MTTKPPENKAIIYIAYRRKDGNLPTGFEKLVEKIVQMNKYEVRVDPGRLSDDPDWVESVRQKIVESDLLLVVITAEVSGSTWTKGEIGWAQAAGIPVLAVFIDSGFESRVEMEKLGLNSGRPIRFDTRDENFGGLVMLSYVIESGRKTKKVKKILLNRQASLPDYSVFQMDNTPKPVMNPTFGNPSFAKQYTCDIFVIMPFREPFNTIYKDHIKPVGEKHGLNVKRGDDFFSSGSIMSEVWSAMFNAYLIIAECTGRNPNVFYELGMAHTLNKPGILLTQSIEDIPFDIRHLRHILYEYTPRGAAELELNLEKAIVKLLYGEDLK